MLPQAHNVISRLHDCVHILPSEQNALSMSSCLNKSNLKTQLGLPGTRLEHPRFPQRSLYAPFSISLDKYLFSVVLGFLKHYSWSPLHLCPSGGGRFTDWGVGRRSRVFLLSRQTSVRGAVTSALLSDVSNSLCAWMAASVQLGREGLGSLLWPHV